MSRWLPVAALGWLAACCCGVAATDDDAVKKKLDAAKQAYKADMEKVDKSVGEWLDKREETARRDGNKKAVDQVKEDRKAFEEKGELPATLPIAVKRKAAVAQSTLIAAYGVAVKEYTRAKKDDEAAAVEKELEEFKAARPAELGAPIKPGDKAIEAPPLPDNDVFDPKLWLSPKKGGVVVAKDGRVQLTRVDTEILTKKSDYAAVEVKVTLSAGKGTVAYVGVGLGGKRPVTSLIVDDGKGIRVGRQSKSFEEERLGKVKSVAYDEPFELALRVTGGVGDVFVNGDGTGGVMYDPRGGQPPPGAVGVGLRKGKVTIKAIELKDAK